MAAGRDIHLAFDGRRVGINHRGLQRFPGGTLRGVSFRGKIITFEELTVSFLVRPFIVGLLLAQHQLVKLRKALFQFLAQALFFLGAGDCRSAGAGLGRRPGGAFALLLPARPFPEFLQGFGQDFIIALFPPAGGG